MDEYQDIKELLRPSRSIGASQALRQRVRAVSAQKHKGTIWFRSAATAACIVLMGGAAMLFNGKGAVATSCGRECIVYVAGQKTGGEEALAIAEADVARMEQFMLTVAQHNDAEQEKVNQFMQHKSKQ
ncbi:MAG: hypothetical protein J6I72_10430 [Muribaculaceae bacterium]|nr:hypothetical protein [Muribaculaceae bacterium]